MDLSSLKQFRDRHSFAIEGMKTLWFNPTEHQKGYLEALEDVLIGINDILEIEEALQKGTEE